MSDRVTELEIQLAHVQRLFDQLNEVVTSQTMEINRLQRRIKMMESQIKELKEKPQPAGDPLDEKPPHY